MATLTSEQLKEVEARIGTSDLSKTQFNIQLPTGEIIPAGINSNQAATIVLGGGVQERSGTPDLTPSASAPIAPVVPVQPTVTPPDQPPAVTPSGTIANLVASARALTTQDKISFINTIAKTNPQVADEVMNKLGIPSVPPAPAGTVSGVSGLTGNVQIDALQTKIDTLRGQIKAGLATGGKTKILEGLFEKFGVQEEIGISKALSQEILKTQEQLRNIPENIKTRLADIGISERQLEALSLREAQKPREVLARLLEQRGASQEAISLSLKFVSLFADTMFEDQATQLKANQFDLEQLQGDYKNLREDQKFLLGKAFDQRGDVLKLQLKMSENKATPQEILDAGTLTPTEIAVKYGKYMGDAKQQVIEGADGNKYLYDFSTGKATRIAGVGGGGVVSSAGFADSKTESKVREDFVDIITNAQYVKNPQSLTDEEKVTAFSLLRQAYSPQQVSDAGLQQLIGMVPKVEQPPAEQAVIEYGKENFATIPFEKRVAQLKQIFSSELDINAQLEKDGYSSRIGFGSVIQGVANVASDVSAFFTKLFNL